MAYVGTADEGKVLTSAGVGASAKFASLTSPNGTITIGFDAPNVTLDLAGGSTGIDSIGVQTGTNPIVPTGAGLITINGSVVVAGTNPVRTDGTGANTLALEVQIAQAIASTDVTKIGLCNFNSGQFSVDANGFVSSIGGSFTWNNQTADLNPIVKQNGYFANKAASRLVLTLPTNAVMGDTYKISGFGSQGWQVVAGAGQIIQLGSGSATSVNGSLSSTNQYDQVELVCSPTTTTFIVRDVVGNLTIA